MQLHDAPWWNSQEVTLRKRSSLRHLHLWVLMERWSAEGYAAEESSGKTNYVASYRI